MTRTKEIERGISNIIDGLIIMMSMSDMAHMNNGSLTRRWTTRGSYQTELVYNKQLETTDKRSAANLDTCRVRSELVLRQDWPESSVCNRWKMTMLFVVFYLIGLR